jgi:uncharacterized glyoxalase superfamily protein PhnB
MKPTPAGWPRVTPGIAYRDANRMIDWLCEAYGFEIRLKVEGDAGSVVHSELTFGSDGLIMVSSEKPADAGGLGVNRLSAASVNANTQSVMVFVDDADAHCAHARAAGATIVMPVADHDYGEDYWTDRSYGATDPEGHLWWFTQRVRDPK